MMKIEQYEENKVIKKPKIWLPLRRKHNSLWGYFGRGLKISVAAILLMWLWCVLLVYQYAQNELPKGYHGDVAVVLGAAAWDVRPSPVFRERINHAITLYRTGQVNKLAFTGGTPKKGFMTEAEVGRRYALRQGIPERDIVLENTSRDTYQNLVNIQPVLREHELNKVVVVSDPYHLARAAAVANDIGLKADFSGTPTSRFSDNEKKLKFMLQESGQLFGYYWWQAGHYVLGRVF